MFLFAIILICGIVLYASLTFRLAYWRQKALNRMSADEAHQARKTGDDFLSFLK